MWERLSALEGGTVSGLTVVSDERGRGVVLAVTPTGLFRSEDGGGSWVAMGRDRALPLAQQVVASPGYARDRTLFSAAHDGLHRSEDGGRTWRLVLIGVMLAIALSPGFEDDGVVFVGTAEDGILRSEDRGTDWSGANAGLLDLAALTVAVSPRMADDRLAFAGTATALYRSRNGGRSWREIDLGLNEPAVQALALSPRFEEDRVVLVGTEADGLLRSDDAGVTFETVPALTGRGISALTFGSNGRTVAVAAGSEVFRSDDGGLTWSALPEAPSLILSLALVEADAGETLLAGLYREGVARLDEVGTWRPSRGGLTARLLTLLVPSPTFSDDRTLFASSIDDGVLVSRDGGLTWQVSWPDDADPGVATLAVSAGYAGDRMLLASTAEGLLRSQDGGATWERSEGAALPLRLVSPLTGSDGPGYVGVTMEEPSDGNSGPLPAAPLHPTMGPLDPHGPASGRGGGSRGHLSVVGAEGATRGSRPLGNALVISLDGGRSWRGLDSRGLGNRAAIGAIVASPAFAQDRTLFAAGAEGRAQGSVVTRLWRSTDAGRTWALWFEEVGAGGALLAGGLLIPPTYSRDARVVLAVGGRVLTPEGNSWERHGGQRRPAWHAAALGPDVVSVTVLAAPADPTVGPIVYAGTNAGPYVSRDGGRSFEPWTDGYDGGIVGLAASPAFTTDRLVFAIGLGGTVWQRTDPA